MSPVRLFAALLFYVTAAPALAGPWMRDVGTQFLAYSGTAALTKQTGLFQQGFDLYFEKGVRETLTFGAEFSSVTDSDTRVIGFVQKPLGKPDAPLKFTYQLGIGARQSDGIWSPILRGGVHMGKGFDHKWGAGWITVAASLEADTGRSTTLAKIDTTFGLNPHPRLKTMLNIRIDKATGGDTGIALAPAIAWKLKKSQHLLIELEARQANTTKFGLKVGVWKDF